MTLMDQIHPNPIFEKRRPTESPILAGSLTPRVASIWYYLKLSQWQMQCKGQPSTPGARLQTTYFTTIMLCSDQINFTLYVHSFHHFDHRRCTNPSKPTSAKGTFPQLRGTGRGIKRDILQRFFASVHRPFCRWSIGLLAVEKVESWRKKKKQTLSRALDISMMHLLNLSASWLFFGRFWNVLDSFWLLLGKVRASMNWMSVAVDKQTWLLHCYFKTQMDQVLKHILNISTGKNRTSSCLQRWRFSKLCQILL